MAIAGWNKSDLLRAKTTRPRADFTSILAKQSPLRIS
jgi:hypothetical protein